MVVERRKGVGVGLTPLLELQACIGPAVDSQLLRHHNKQGPHKGQPAEQSGQCGTLAGSTAPPPHPPKKALAINFSTVATETELSLLGLV